MYNKAFLIGNLVRDPEVRYTTGGIPVARFTIAVNRPKPKSAKSVDGKDDVDFIPVVAWRRLAEICGEYLKKGRPVAIEGRLQVQTYEKNGEKRVDARVVADGMQMLGSRPAGSSNTPSAGAPPSHPEEGHGGSGEEAPF